MTPQSSLRTWMNAVALMESSPRVLFHATHFRVLAQILAQDMLAANTTDVARGVKGPGVSLTRSFEYAWEHKGPRMGVVLVIDATGLSTTPVQYWTPEEQKRYGRKDEAEEFVTGPIEDLHRRIISIDGGRFTSQDFEKLVAERIADEPPNRMQDYDPEGYAAIVRYGIEGARRDAGLWNRWKPPVEA